MRDLRDLRDRTGNVLVRPWMPILMLLALGLWACSDTGVVDPDLLTTSNAKPDWAANGGKGGGGDDGGDDDGGGDDGGGDDGGGGGSVYPSVQGQELFGGLTGTVYVLRTR